MPIDARIAMGFQQPQFESPINSLANIMQLQGAQQANQLNQMKMDEYGRGVQRTNALQSLLSGEYDTPEARQSAMIKGGFLKEASDYGKSNSAAADAASKRKTEELTQANKRIDLAGSVFGYVRQNPTPENAFAALDHLASNGIYSPEQVAEYKAKIQANPQAVAQMADLAFRGALSAKEQLAKNGDFNAGGTQQFTSTDPVSGKVTPTGSIAITESENNKANNIRIAQEGAANRDVQIRGQNLTDARSRDANGIAADTKKIATDQAKAGQVASFDVMLDSLDRLSKHPGLSRSVGKMSITPTMPGSDSANFQAELETFKSQAFIPMVAQLKGMGALSDAEGKKLTAAVGALDPKMGETAFRQSIKRITENMNEARARVSGTAAPAGNTVQTPDGQTHSFPNAAAAAAFKKAAGL